MTCPESSALQECMMTIPAVKQPPWYRMLQCIGSLLNDVKREITFVGREPSPNLRQQMNLYPWVSCWVSWNRAERGTNVGA